MTKFFSISLAIAGLINLLPVIGVFSQSIIEWLYQINIVDSDLTLLMRHRAVLFGLVGSLLFYSLLKSELRIIVAIIALVSMLSFSLLTWLLNIDNDKLIQIAMIDLVASLILIAGLATHRHQLKTQSEE